MLLETFSNLTVDKSQIKTYTNSIDNNTMSIIEAHSLTKKYGDFTAVNSISFQVHKGETFGILGPNGAGKTTTLEMIEGLKGITSGSVLVDGNNVAEEAEKVKSIIGVQLQASTFFDGLNLVELLETFGALYGRKVNALALLSEVQLTEKANNTVKELSGGQKQRLSIAVALVNNPKVIFLDEPTTGLDPQARRNLWELVKQIKQRGTTVVLTTHYMDEAQVLCDRIAIMDNAKIIALDTTANLLKLAGVLPHIKFTASKNVEPRVLETLPGATKAEVLRDAYRLETRLPEETLPALFELSKKDQFSITHVQLEQPTLEDVFLKLTGHTLRE